MSNRLGHVSDKLERHYFIYMTPYIRYVPPRILLIQTYCKVSNCNQLYKCKRVLCSLLFYITQRTYTAMPPKPSSKGAKKAANKAKVAKAARTSDKKSRNVRELSSMESGKQEQERSTRSSGQHIKISITLDDPSDFESCRNKMLVDSDGLTHPPSSSSSRTQSVSSYATVMGDDDIAVIGVKRNLLS